MERKFKIAIADEPGYAEIPYIETFEYEGELFAVHHTHYSRLCDDIDTLCFQVSHFKTGRKITRASEHTKELAIKATKHRIKHAGVGLFLFKVNELPQLNTIEL